MRLLSKIVAIAVSAIMAACMFGCGSSNGAKESGPDFEVQTIEVNDAGFAITNEGTLLYAFVAVNPNDGHVAQDVVFTVEAYNSEGSMIVGDSQTIPVLYPGIEAAGAGEAELFAPDTANPEVANLTISAMMDSVVWTTTTLSADEIDAMDSITYPRATTGDGGLTIKANIEMATGEEAPENMPAQIEVRAVAVLFDDGGQAICGTEPVTFTLSQDEADYSFSGVIENAPKYAECKLYASPASLL